MKRKVRRIAGALAERLSHIEGVQAVLLGEAAEVEVFDPYFTIDLDVYSSDAPPAWRPAAHCCPARMPSRAPR